MIEVPEGVIWELTFAYFLHWETGFGAQELGFCRFFGPNNPKM